jgi:hypothetical protein
MIIVNLKGGLGNQMFQYACGRALSLRNGEILKMDISGFARTSTSDTPRVYSLSEFNIASNTIASEKEIQKLKYPYSIISKGWRFIKAKISREGNIGWNKHIFSKTGTVYLDGFWQTEKYFSDCKNTIRQEFTLKNPLGSEARVIAGKVGTDRVSPLSPSVAIHIRRGDVARDAKKNLYYGICTTEYYANALAYMAKRLGNFRVFIFSDDIDWVKENMLINQPVTYISGKMTDCEELILMSMCNHAIIANSSFSWWGAWLNKNPQKIILAPKEWITKAHYRHKDTVPPSWIRI